MNSPETITLKSASHAEWIAGVESDGFNPIHSGDLADRPPHIVAQIINNSLRGYVQPALEEHYHPQNGDISPVGQLAQELERQNSSFKAFAQEYKDANKETYGMIAQRYDEADRIAAQLSIEKGLSEEESKLFRAAMRLATADTTAIKADFDGTFSETTNAAQDYLMPYVPGSVHLEAEIAKYGRDQFTPLYAATVRPALRDLPQTFEVAGEQIKLRPGVADFIEYIHEEEIPIDIITANFKPIIKGALRGIPYTENVKIHGITPDDTRAVEKGAIL
ncbi:MAG: hypothetical protein NUV98_06305, partial [Candidatus Roizmanbacteria bacterium]|nr:hypothetical protein [Candidatus Roizmanbacteria bacterium]